MQRISHMQLDAAIWMLRADRINYGAAAALFGRV